MNLLVEYLQYREISAYLKKKVLSFWKIRFESFYPEPNSSNAQEFFIESSNNFKEYAYLSQGKIKDYKKPT